MDKISHIGIVEEIKGQAVQVRIQQASACDLCHAKSMCSSADTKEKFIELAQVNAEPFTARVGDALFVFLDANYYDDGSTYEPGHTLWTNSYITQEQLDFYADAWKNTDAESVYVFSHQNIDPTCEARHVIKNSEHVVNELAKCPKLKGVYQGHYHKGNENVIGGVGYHTLPALCEGENMPYVIIEV